MGKASVRKVEMFILELARICSVLRSPGEVITIFQKSPKDAYIYFPTVAYFQGQMM